MYTTHMVTRNGLFISSPAQTLRFAVQARPDAVTFNTAMSACLKGGMPDQARKVKGPWNKRENDDELDLDVPLWLLNCLRTGTYVFWIGKSSCLSTINGPLPIGMLNSQMVCGTIDGMLNLWGWNRPTTETSFDPDQDHEHPLVMEKTINYIIFSVYETNTIACINAFI